MQELDNDRNIVHATAGHKLLNVVRTLNTLKGLILNELSHIIYCLNLYTYF